MKTNLRILYLEDEPNDAELVREILTAADFECEILRVETRNDFTAALKEPRVDLILSDKSLPVYDGLTALSTAREQRPEVPFIFVSGTLGEEVAIESLKNGATDYVLKQRLERLVPVIWRALHEFEEQQERKKAEQALRENEKRFRDLIEHSSDAIALVSADGTILYASPSTTRITGYASYEFVGHSFFEFLHPDDLGSTTELFRNLLEAQHKSSSAEYRFRRKDGEWRWMEAVGTNLLAEPGVEAIVVNYRDIQERKAADDKLVQSEHRFRALIENSSDAVVLVSAEGTVKYVSPAAQRILGIPPDTIIGTNGFESLHPDDAPTAQQLLGRVLQNPDVPFSSQVRFRHFDGSWRWVDVTATNLLADPAVQAIVCNFRDVTDSKHAEQLTALLASIVENSDDAILSTTLGGVITSWNRGAEKMHGYTAEQVVGQSLSTLIPSDRSEELADILARAERGESIYHFETVRVRQDGARIDVSLTISPVKDATGKITGASTIARDITQRKKGEAALAESERHYRQLIETAHEGVWVLGVDDRTTFVNQRLADMLGYSVQELMGKSLYDFMDEEGKAFATQDLALRRQGIDEQIDFKFIRKDGSEVWTLMETSTLLNQQQEYIGALAMLTDITERRQAQVALNQSEKRFRALVENSSDGITLLNTNGTLAYASDSTKRILGYAPEEIVGCDPLEMIHPEDQPSILGVLGKLIASPGSVETAIYRMRHKDGSWHWIESTINNLITEPAVQAFVFNYRDVTERKRAEEEIQQRAAEFAALYETANELMTQTDLTSLLETVVQRAMTLLNAPGGALLFYDAVRRDLEIVVSLGAALKPGIRIQMGQGIAGHVAETRQPMIVNDYSNWSERPTELPDFGLRASIQVPMVYQGELIGVLALDEINAEHVFGESDLNLLSLFASQAAGAVHSARLVTQTQQRANQLASVYDAGLALNSVLEPRAQLEFLFKIATRGLHADRAEFFRYNPVRNELRFELGIGHPPETLARIRNQVLSGEDENDIAGWVGKYRVPLSVPDVSAEARWHGGQDAQIHSGLWVAVEHENNLLGILSVLSEQLHAFTPMDERLLVLFANQAAVALQNARLFEETTRRAAHLSTLNGIGRAISTLQNIDEVLEVIYQQVQHSLLLDTFYVCLYDPETNQLSYPIMYDGGQCFQESPTPMHEGTNLSRVVQTCTPLLLNRTTEELTADPLPLYALGEETKKSASLLYAPLQVGTRVIGVMSAQSYILNAYNDEHLALLSGIANQAAIAIENARLFDQTRRQVERLGALRAIDMAISGSVDLRVTLNIFLEQVVKQLEVDAASVLFFNPYLNTLEYAAGRGFRTRAIERLTLRLGQGFAGEAALYQKLVFLPNLSARENESPRLSQLKAEAFEAYVIVPLLTKGNVRGVLEIFHRAPLNLAPEWLDFLEALGGQAAIAIDNASLFKGLQRSNADLSLAYDATIEGWSKALDLRDKETEGHAQRVTEMTLRLARSMQVREEELVHIRRGALLHDIGKMGIPDHILLKPGPLTEEEWVLMRQHPTLAFGLLSSIAYLQPALSIPYCHHEKWDGTGYPRGLIGEQIPQAARIFAVADVWDALHSDRPYRNGWIEEKVREYIREQSGKHFDPKVVDAFLALDSAT